MIIDPSVIRQVSREKDIDPEKMFAALEEAMSSAARKFYRDKAVVTAMAKGKELTIKAKPTKGADVSDTYVLAGFGEALAAIDKACKVKR